MGNNFENQVRKAMSKATEYPFEKRMWKDMSVRLDKAQKQPKKKIGFLLPLLWIISLGATGMAAYLYTNQKALSEQIAMYDAQKKNNTLIVNDTIVQKHVTVVYDTVYRQVTIAQIANQQTTSPLTNGLNPYLLTGQFGKHNGTWTFGDNPISPQKGHIWSLGLADYVHNKGAELAAGIHDANFREYFDSSFLPYLPSGLFPLNADLTLPEVVAAKRKTKKTAKYYAFKMKPNGLSINVSQGKYFPLNFRGSKYESYGNFMANIQYPNDMSLIIGAGVFEQYFNFRYSENKPPVLTDYPNITKDVDEVYGQFDFIEIPVGLQYKIIKKASFVPYIGAGVNARKELSSSLTYVRGTNNVVKTDLRQKTFEMDSAWGKIGFNHAINRKWSVFVEGSATFGIEQVKYKYDRHQLLGITGGIQYKVK